MRTIIVCFFMLVFSNIANANMAYMGPAHGQVSGINLGANVRVLYEKLTADLRKLPSGDALVFADYKLMCKGNGMVQFLFVASSEKPVYPEIILDGKLIQATPIITPWDYSIDGELSKAKSDSLSNLIGYDLKNKNYFHQQPIQNEIFKFEVQLTEGIHHLKVGYSCMPTGYEMGSLRYTVFPYFLGNQTTKKQYDSIFVHVLLPEEADYTTNFDIASKSREGFVSANLAGFDYSHIKVSLFKNVEAELSTAWNIFQAIAWTLLLVITIFLLIMLRRRLLASKRIYTVFFLYVVPGSVVAGFAYYYGMIWYYEYFENKYGMWLEGSWGRGYLFLVVPAVIMIVGGIWTSLLLMYPYLFFNKKWDFMRVFDRKQRI